MTMELCLAYIDPGAGSILLQIFLGGILGVGVYLRHHIARLFRAFRRSA